MVGWSEIPQRSERGFCSISSLQITCQIEVLICSSGYVRPGSLQPQGPCLTYPFDLRGKREGQDGIGNPRRDR